METDPRHLRQAANPFPTGAATPVRESERVRESARATRSPPPTNFGRTCVPSLSYVPQPLPATRKVFPNEWNTRNKRGAAAAAIWGRAGTNAFHGRQTLPVRFFLPSLLQVLLDVFQNSPWKVLCGPGPHLGLSPPSPPIFIFSPLSSSQWPLTGQACAHAQLSLCIHRPPWAPGPLANPRLPARSPSRSPGGSSNQPPLRHCPSACLLLLPRMAAHRPPRNGT